MLLWISGVPMAQSVSPEIAPFYALVQRLVPRYANAFSAEFIPGDNGMDVFELEQGKKKVILRGNNVNALAVALNYYLKYYCHTSVSWYADDPVELPDSLPVITQPIRLHARMKDRFFLNYCTFGYTMPWWQWKDWERFIDWMALNGINMPLAMTGQEAIWYRVWQKFGLNDAEIRGYFTGPAHLPWHRMSNIDRIQGPLPASYIRNQELLQRHILGRERALGMKPVLPAFAGHVPGVIKNKYPQAHISRLRWGLFPDQYQPFFLDPLDPLFKRIQRLFLEEQTRTYGTDHLYGADPFNEVKPPRWDSAFLRQVGQTIYGSIRQTDDSATWLMMAWIFYFEREQWTNQRIQNLLSAIPQERILLLDYYCENQEVWSMTNSFFGYSYLWCYLGNFGGNTMLAGNLDTVSARIDRAYRFGGSNLRGIGSTLEGLDVNPLLYEYVFEKAWDNNLTDSVWVEACADRRYGRPDTAVRKAWSILASTVYRSPARLGQGMLTNARPSLYGNGASRWTDPTINYHNDDLFLAWKLLLEKESKRSSYKYDIVNIGRQYLGNLFRTMRDDFSSAYRLKDISTLVETGNAMLDLLNDLDELLSSNPDFLLGKWLNDAKQMGSDEKEMAYFEQNARTILTIWGIKDNSLNDYANRSWAGLMKTFYRERWRLFIGQVIAAAKKGKTFDEKAFYSLVTRFEWEWTKERTVLPSAPVGDSYSIARRLMSKYGPEYPYGRPKAVR
jgi:alpha-N-acetylglucosaminidase